MEIQLFCMCWICSLQEASALCFMNKFRYRVVIQPVDPCCQTASDQLTCTPFVPSYIMICLFSMSIINFVLVIIIVICWFNLDAHGSFVVDLCGELWYHLPGHGSWENRECVGEKPFSFALSQAPLANEKLDKMIVITTVYMALSTAIGYF